MSGTTLGPAMGSRAGEPAASRHHRAVDPDEAVRRLPHGISLRQRDLRFALVHGLTRLAALVLTRTTLVGRENFLDRPALYCFNHLGWLDPLAMLAVFPTRPRMWWYGPKEEDMSRGWKNHLIWWTAMTVPFSPHKDDLLTSVKRAQAVFDAGGSLAIAGEGRIHVHEGALLPLQEGSAYLALRAGVPIVPVAITGTSRATLRTRITIRIGEAIETGPRPTRAAVDAYTARLWHALHAMVADDRDPEPPGRIGAWFTDLFNDWGPGGRAAASLEHGPRPEDVPQPPLPPVSEAEGQGGVQR